ncbi:hypothetical protein CYY_010500, partial [Polysphondylium violaceum]
MDEGEKRTSSLQVIIRNKYLFHLIIEQVSLQRKGDYYIYRNGSPFTKYDEIELPLLLSPNRSKSLLNEKMKNFHRVLVETKEYSNHNSSAEFTTYYQDWIDFNLNSIERFNKGNDQEINIETILSIPTDKHDKLIFIEEFVLKFGLNRKRLELLDKVYPRDKVYNVTTLDLSDIDFLNSLIDQDRIQLKHYGSFEFNPLFYQHKDTIRRIKGWNDILFVNELIRRCLIDNARKFDQQLFTWALTVSPEINWQLFCAEKGVDPSNEPYAELYGVKIRKTEKPFFFLPSHVTSYFLVRKELFIFMETYYPELLSYHFNDDMLLIKNMEIAQLVFNHPAFSPNTKLYTKDAQVYKFFNSKCSINFLFYQNLLTPSFDLDPLSYSSEDLYDLYEIMVVAGSIDLISLINVCIIKGCTDIIKNHFSQQPVPPLFSCLHLSFQSNRMDIFHYLEKVLDPLMSPKERKIQYTELLNSAIAAHDYEYSVKFFEKLQSTITQDILKACLAAVTQAKDQNKAKAI